MISEFHFLRPLWLLALAPLAWLLWRMARGDSNTNMWREICDPSLLPYLLIGAAVRKRRWLYMVGLAWLLSVIALAGPTWKQLEQPIFKSRAALIIVLDLSLSMAVTDLKPSRITRARFKVLDILQRNREGQVALIVFAGDAFVISPLTDDVQTITALVPVLSPEIMPTQGSRIVLGLRKADELLKQAGVSDGEVVVVTDGISELEQAMTTIREIHSHGRRVSFLGVGTSQGAPIPLPHGTIMKDADGAIVIPKLDAIALQQLAQAGGGQFSPITPDNSDLSSIFAPQPATWFAPAESTMLRADQWREDGIWLVILLLPIACLAFRRGWVLLIVLGVALPSHQVEALEWRDLWFRADQQAAKIMDAGNAASAAALFKNVQWRATAHYRAGRFDLALAAFATSHGADAQYNRGNTLVQLGDLRNAIIAYELALDRDPQHVDALHNKELVENHLRQLQRASGGHNSRRSPEGESTSSSGFGRTGQGNEDSTDDTLARREEETEAFKERVHTGADEDYEFDLNEQFSLVDIQSSRYSSGNRSGQQREHTPSVQALDDPNEGAGSRKNTSFVDARLTILSTEQRQALEQWLRRIPDDPGGLFRRKLLLEHKRRRYAGKYEYSATPW